MAVWVHGGVGTGHFSQGYPPLEKLLIGMAPFYDIVVYSQSAIRKDYRSPFFQLFSAPEKIRGGLLRWFYLFARFFKDHRKKKIDLIFGFWGYPAGFLATCLSKVTGVPCSVYVLGSDSAGIPSVNFGIFHKPLPRSLALWTYRNCNLLFAISEFQRKQLIKYGVAKPITVIPWGVDTALYHFSEKERRSVLRIIHVGHLTPVKDQSTLLRAVALINEKHPVELKLFGVDCMNGAIQNLSRELGVGDKVAFQDMIPYDQMPDQYAWADVMLHTSLSEGQSMALTEGAATGVLLAGTNVGLLFDLGNDCGICVEVGDFKSLASNVLKILRDEDDWNRRVQNAKKWSESHDLTWTVNTLKQSLDTL